MTVHQKRGTSFPVDDRNRRWNSRLLQEEHVKKSLGAKRDAANTDYIKPEDSMEQIKR